MPTAHTTAEPQHPVLLSGAPNGDDWHRQRAQEIRVMLGIIENKSTKNKTAEHVEAILAARKRADEALMRLVAIIEGRE